MLNGAVHQKKKSSRSSARETFGTCISWWSAGIDKRILKCPPQQHAGGRSQLCFGSRKHRTWLMFRKSGFGFFKSLYIRQIYSSCRLVLIFAGSRGTWLFCLKKKPINEFNPLFEHALRLSWKYHTARHQPIRQRKTWRSEWKEGECNLKEIVGGRVLGRNATSVLRCCFKYLIFRVELLVELENGSHIPAAVAVVGCGPNRHKRVFEHALVALHHKLVRAANEL